MNIHIPHLITCLAVLASVVLLALSYSKVNKKKGGGPKLPMARFNADASCSRLREGCNSMVPGKGCCDFLKCSETEGWGICVAK